MVALLYGFCFNYLEGVKIMKNVLVSTSVWYDIIELSANAKLIFLYTVVNDRLDLSGCYRLTPAVIAAETGIDLHDVNTSISELTSKKILFFKDSWFIIPSIFLSQNLNNFKIRKAIEKRINDLPIEIYNWFSSVMDDLSISYKYLIQSEIINDNSNINSNNNDNIKSIKSNSNNNSKNMNVNLIRDEDEDEDRVLFFDPEMIEEEKNKRNDKLLNMINSVTPSIQFDELPSELSKVYASLIHAKTGKSPAALYAACINDFRLTPINPQVECTFCSKGLTFYDIDKIKRDNIDPYNTNWIEIKKYKKNLSCPVCKNGENPKIKKDDLEAINFIINTY